MLAHENNDHLGIQTEIVRLDGDFVVVKAALESKGESSTAREQPQVKEMQNWQTRLVELAETRSHRSSAALRRDLASNSPVQKKCPTWPPQILKKSKVAAKQPAPVFPEGNGNGKVAAKAPSGAPAETGSKPQSGGIGQATQAQCRALYALTKRANYHEADIGEMLARFEVSRFEDLTRESASQLIGHLQTQVAA